MRLLKTRNVCGFVVLLMVVVGVAGALAWGNRFRADRKAKTPKVTSPPIASPPNRRSSLPFRSTSSRVKRQTVLGVIDVVPGEDGVEPNGVAVNPITNRVYTTNSASNNVSVIDAATNLVIASVPVGVDPRGLAVNANTNKIYVANRHDDTVSVIDGATNTVTATISVGTNPTGVGINPITNRIYVANQNSNDVSVIDGATNLEVARVPVETFPTGVGVNPTTNRIYVSNYVSGTVSVIDGATNATNTVRLEPDALALGVGVNPNTNRIYVASDRSEIDGVFVIDGITQNVVNTIDVERTPVEIAVNNVTNTVYVTNQDQMIVIDGATDTVTTTVTMGIFLQGVAVNTVRNRVYVTNMSSNTVNVVDGVTNAVTDVITLGSLPGGIATNPTLNRLYVPNGRASDTVSVIDGATNQVIGSAGVGSNPTEAAVNTVTNRVYVVNADDSTLSVIDGATNKTTTTVTMPGMGGVSISGGGATSVAVNSATNRVYVTSAILNQVVVVNGVNDSVVTTIAVGGNPKGVAVNPNTNRIYVANETGNSVSVIDGVSNTVLTTVPVGSAPRRIDVNPTTNMIYVTNDQSLSVIDGATNTVTTTIPLEFSPWDVAANPATNKVYVTDGVGQTIVIDGFTHTIVDVVTTADAPFTVAVNPNTGLVYLGNTMQGTVTVLHDPLSTHSATVFNTNDNGPGSLRQALMDANAHPGTTIVFRIPRSDPGFDSTDGVFIIRPNSPLPPISSETVIDGATQTEFTGDTNPEGPEIVIHGGSAGASAIGLVMNNAAHCVLNRLVINGFSLSGISINGANATGNLITNCYIGTNARGDAAVPNRREGVVISAGAHGNLIGGGIEGGGNLISGNGGNGVEIRGAGSDSNVVMGNLIGVNRSGDVALPNGGSGVLIDSSNNLIGGPNAGEFNVISGNGANGVHILGSGAGNRVQQNVIGMDISGAVALGNAAHGVLIDGSSQNVIGSTVAPLGNRIAHNALDGVRVAGDSATQNRLLSNVIHDNGGLGINLVGGSEDAFGVTANDPNDADGSPNKLQNFPVLSLAETDGDFTTVSGSLDSAPTHAAYPVLIQFFVSSAADPSGFGEGKQLLASHVLNAPGNFSLNNLPAVPVGAMLTATATDNDGNTSEFSQAIPVSTMSLGVAHLSIGATPSVVEVNGQSIIEVRATDNGGNAVPDTDITFQTTGGTLSANADTTDANGRARVILSQIPFGTTTVTAEANSVRVTVEVKGVLRIGVPAGVNLLSFPLNVSAGQVDDLFRGGRVDVARWVPSPLTRLGHYEFFSQQPFDLNAGQGYWVRSDVAQTVEITNGTLPDPQQPARITFERDTPGWDLRGNPSVRDLLFDITRIKVLENGVSLGTLADIARDGRDAEPIVEPYCWKWTNDAAGAGYELVIDPRLLAVLAIPPDIGRAIADNHLERGRGAFFFLRRRNLALEFPPALLVTHAARAQRTKREPVKPSVDNWTLGLQAHAANIHTGESVIGVSEKIQTDLQVKKSPPLTSQQFVDLSLLNAKNETLAWDVRAARAPKMTWDVLVTTNQTGTVSLTYPHLSRLPKNLRAYIVDPDSGKRQFMRTTTHYTFPPNSSGITQKRLRIEVTSETDGKLRVNGLQATVGGSDAARLVRLSFVLNREATVGGRVLSPTGKIIRALTPMAAPRGLNVVSWDGKTQGGGVAGRGVYVIELVAEDGEGEQVRAVRLVTLR